MSPETYELSEARFIQEQTVLSGANSLYVAVGPVPNGKIWSILSASQNPSVAETKTNWFAILSRSLNPFPVTLPSTILLNTTILMAFLEQGMELKLFPGEYLAGYRDSATAGSTMTIKIRFIESDLPYYSYVEPLKRVSQSLRKHGSSFRSSGGGVGGGGGGGGGHDLPGGGGGGGAELV
jgi:uncharacterized membrane protein YgcG